MTSRIALRTRLGLRTAPSRSCSSSTRVGEPTTEQVLKAAKLPRDDAIATVWEDQHVISPQGLEALLAHRVVALVVRDFFPNPFRAQVIKQVEEAVQAGQSRNWPVVQSADKLVDSEVCTLGTPMSVANIQGQASQYFAEALTTTRRFRRGGEMSPLDKLRLELDEVYKHGCNVARDPATNRLHAAGLMRVMKRSSSKGLVHIDDVSPMEASRGIFSANIYLQKSFAGGELEIWPTTLKTNEELARHALTLGLLTSESADPISQSTLRGHLLPDPPVVVVPNEGDLVLLCVQRPHAVRGPLHGGKLRISAQCFITHALGQPLTVDV